MKACGMIIDSKSPWSFTVRLVKKKDDLLRVCIDYHKVNDVTVKDSYPLPKIEDFFPILSGALSFTTLDLFSGYYHVRIEEKSRKFTSLAVENSFYEYVMMPMGLTNACATFQRLMNTILADLIGKICVVYLADVLIFSKTKEHL